MPDALGAAMRGGNRSGPHRLHVGWACRVPQVDREKLVVGSRSQGMAVIGHRGSAEEEVCRTPKTGQRNILQEQMRHVSRRFKLSWGIAQSRGCLVMWASSRNRPMFEHPAIIYFESSTSSDECGTLRHIRFLPVSHAAMLI
jgi:hypothetical protein